MRWTEPLDEILGSRAKVRTLRVLSRAEEPLSGREVARRAGLSHTGALGALDDLVRQNVVSLSTGKYRTNPDHYVAAAVLPLLAVERRLDAALIGKIAAAVPGLLSMVIFGSVARGEDGPESDLDLLVVVEDRTDVFKVLDAIDVASLYLLFGKLVEPLVWTRSELSRHARQGTPVLSEILREGRLVWGDGLPIVAPRGRRHAG